MCASAQAPVYESSRASALSSLQDGSGILLLHSHQNQKKPNRKRRRFCTDSLLRPSFLPLISWVLIRTISSAVKHGASGFAAEPFAQMEGLQTHLHGFAFLCRHGNGLVRFCTSAGINVNLQLALARFFASFTCGTALSSTGNEPAMTPFV